MIIRIDHQWTTIQCKNLGLKGPGSVCNLCFKVLNDKFALIQRCPYCLRTINLTDWAKERETEKGGK